MFICNFNIEIKIVQTLKMKYFIFLNEANFWDNYKITFI